MNILVFINKLEKSIFFSPYNSEFVVLVIVNMHMCIASLKKFTGLEATP